MNENQEVYLAYALPTVTNVSDLATPGEASQAGQALLGADPQIDVSLLGLDLTGLKVGRLSIGGVELFGVKDYEYAPMSKGEALVYVSYLAGLLAVDPDAWEAMGPDALHPDPMVAARAARVYVAANTPIAIGLKSDQILNENTVSRPNSQVATPATTAA